MIPEKDRKDITLVRHPNKDGFKIASQHDKIDIRIPKFTAKLGGTEKIGKKVNQLLAIPLKNQLKVSALSIVPITKNEEQNNSLQILYVNGNEHREQTDNEDEVGYKIKTKNEDPKDDTDRNLPNAVGNSKKSKKSSNKHLREEKTANPIQN